MYHITKYTYHKAKLLGVTVKPSTVKGKKIDVFKNDKKIASIGGLGYGDYPTFLAKYGKEYADMKRNAYKKRHQKDRMERWTPGWLADQLLW